MHCDLKMCNLYLGVVMVFLFLVRFLAVEKQHLESCQDFPGPRESHDFLRFLTEDWIEKHAELQVALALAVGEQQLEPWMQHREEIVRGCSQVKFMNLHSLAEIISFWPVLRQLLPLLLSNR